VAAECIWTLPLTFRDPHRKRVTDWQEAQIGRFVDGHDEIA
jgi:hypothetical protein